MADNRFQNPNQPIPDQNFGFQNNREVSATRGVKLRNKNAERIEQEKIDKENYKRQFEQNADKTITYHDQKERKTMEVISRFLNLTRDKTLERNRGGIAADVEREIRQEFLQLVIDLNNDENEEENDKGSAIAVSLLCKIILSYRDRLNELEFELGNLKREIKIQKSS